MYEVVKKLCSRSLIFLTNSFSFSFSKRCLNWAKWFWKKSSEVIPWERKKYSIASTIHSKEWISLLEKGGVVRNTGVKEKNPSYSLYLLLLLCILWAYTSNLFFAITAAGNLLFQGKTRIQLNHMNPRARASRKALLALQLVMWQVVKVQTALRLPGTIHKR